jgi:hypothetical protein
VDLLHHLVAALTVSGNGIKNEHTYVICVIIICYGNHLIIISNFILKMVSRNVWCKFIAIDVIM